MVLRSPNGESCVKYGTHVGPSLSCAPADTLQYLALKRWGGRALRFNFLHFPKSVAHLAPRTKLSPWGPTTKNAEAAKPRANEMLHEREKSRGAPDSATS
ncbi:hypothetical protein NDU88_002815 [Pleurodeles waltl]|uniref:Uncharacterized protein n=1 Tax=Pleurodeles waltl TaxID=8319 RepID=A0AAV7NI48_PLEWA|nr:hypothetical protein NDU88_002815 [Pleurodeles waltl]